MCTAVNGKALLIHYDFATSKGYSYRATGIETKHKDFGLKKRKLCSRFQNAEYCVQSDFPTSYHRLRV